MNMKKYLFTILILCGVFNFAYASTYTVYSKSSSFYGTSFYQGPNNNLNLVTHVGGYGDHYYTFTQFNLTGAPTTGITSAVLYYHATSTNTANPVPQVYRVTATWASTTLSSSVNPNWDSGTADSFSPAWALAIGWNTVDITNFYNEWVGGSYTNYGVTLRDTVNSPNTDTQVDSIIGNNPYQPYILVTYTSSTASVQGTLNVQGKLSVQ